MRKTQLTGAVFPAKLSPFKQAGVLPWDSSCSRMRTCVRNLTSNKKGAIVFTVCKDRTARSPGPPKQVACQRRIRFDKAFKHAPRVKSPSRRTACPLRGSRPRGYHQGGMQGTLGCQEQECFKTEMQRKLEVAGVDGSCEAPDRRQQ